MPPSSPVSTILGLRGSELSRGLKLSEELSNLTSLDPSPASPPGCATFQRKFGLGIIISWCVE